MRGFIYCLKTMLHFVDKVDESRLTVGRASLPSWLLLLLRRRLCALWLAIWAGFLCYCALITLIAMIYRLLLWLFLFLLLRLSFNGLLARRLLLQRLRLGFFYAARKHHLASSCLETSNKFNFNRLTDELV